MILIDHLRHVGHLENSTGHQNSMYRKKVKGINNKMKTLFDAVKKKFKNVLNEWTIG